ncbi:MAG: NOL1/NOP2/sun family putative RNA methylase [Candidatus Nanohaloarchaea archaeon]|jgi:NOL1/NOP2/sun family putative RNA methylase
MEKYREIIDNWQKFQEHADKHAQSTVRRNPLKAGGDFEEKLSEHFKFEQAKWNQKVYRVKTETPGKSILQWRGNYYVQEESASLPVKVLEPQEDEKILDMCAAPGGKTTQIAAQTRNNADIIANDESQNRIQSLQMNIYRTGAASATVTNYDGRNMPENEQFDKILLDAPCTGEGDRYRRTFEPADKSEIKGLSSLQKELLEKAEKMLKPGGTLVYSTCTINPFENEAVVKYAVENTDLELEDIETDITHTRGVSRFEDENYGAEMNKTVRVYPHHMNSGVIYVAKFTK